MAEQLAPILNLERVSKAIAGGRSAAIASLAGGGAVTGMILPWIPERLLGQVPWWAYGTAAAAVAIVSFIGGFADVYYAKENAPPLIVAPEGTKVVPEAAVVAGKGKA